MKYRLKPFRHKFDENTKNYVAKLALIFIPNFVHKKVEEERGRIRRDEESWKEELEKKKNDEE